MPVNFKQFFFRDTKVRSGVSKKFEKKLSTSQTKKNYLTRADRVRESGFGWMNYIRIFFFLDSGMTI